MVRFEEIFSFLALAVASQLSAVSYTSRGVAARALHLSRGAEKPSGRVTYIVVLEEIPRVFGVLTCDDMDQALNRAGGKAGNKGV